MTKRHMNKSVNDSPLTTTEIYNNNKQIMKKVKKLKDDERMNRKV